MKIYANISSISYWAPIVASPDIPHSQILQRSVFGACLGESGAFDEIRCSVLIPLQRSVFGACLGESGAFDEIQCSVFIPLQRSVFGIQCSVFSHPHHSDPEPNWYIYHSDHLGSSAFLTDASGDPTQHLQYMPFGENFIEQRSITSYYTPYTFSAKERDTETGYSYFGARYYDADISVWLSVDPIIKSFESPYVYCYNRPVRFIDPNGMDPDPAGKFKKLAEKFENSGGGYIKGYRLASYINRNSTALGRHDARYSRRHRTVSYEFLDSRGGEFPNTGKRGNGKLEYPGLETDVKWLCVAGIVRSNGGENRKLKAFLTTISSTNEAFYQAYKYGDHTIRYAERVNGTLRTAKELTQVNNLHAEKMARGLKTAGRGLTGLSIISSVTELYYSEQEGEDWARMTGSVVITATAAIPVVGPFISLGLGVADSFGAFDSIYESFNK